LVSSSKQRGEPRQAFEACRELFDCFSRRTFYAGPCASGAKMKLVSNLVLGLNRAALAEGLVFAEAIGLKPAAALEVLMGTMAYSRIMDTKGQKMIDRDFRTQARLSQHLKDVRLMLESAADAGLALPSADNSAIIQAFDF
jgi:3-hydroxyisobutyrate dehydrogenase-like beta-hydroxyacid dehydrogenase